MIENFYLIDDDFKTMYDDYCLSILNIEKFKRESLKDKMRAREYEDLSRTLEKEIIHYI